MNVNRARRNIGRNIRLFSKGVLEFRRRRYDPIKNTSKFDITVFSEMKLIEWEHRTNIKCVDSTCVRNTSVITTRQKH